MEMYHGDEDIIEAEHAYDAQCAWNMQCDAEYYELEGTKINNDPLWAA
jgi:hypothetical protein